MGEEDKRVRQSITDASFPFARGCAQTLTVTSDDISLCDDS